MAKVIKIDKKGELPFLIDATGMTYEVTKNVKVNLESYILFEQSTSSSNTINIFGKLIAKSQDTVLYAAGDSTAITIGKSGSLKSEFFGVHLEGTSQTLTNFGSIDGALSAIYVNSDFTSIVNKGKLSADDDHVVIDIRAPSGADAIVLNDGSITGHRGIAWKQAEGTLTLGKHSNINVDEIAIYRDNTAGLSAETINRGTIKAATAYYNVEGDDTVINKGKISGDIILGAGNDTFDNSRGSFKGLVQGGAGDDTYYVNSAKIVILETAVQGTDTLNSSVSYKLQTDCHIEFVNLTGKGNINATGSADINTIVGNAGKNILSGMGGDDVLTGGARADIFVMSTGFGRDVITDFENGIDGINVHRWTGIDSFADIQPLMTQGDGFVEIALGQDSLVLTGILLADLDKKDFLF